MNNFSIIPFLFEETIPEKNKREGRMVAFYIPKKIGNIIQDSFSDYEGEEVHPEDMHITLSLIKDGENKDILDSMKHLAKYLKPFTIKIRGCGEFEPNQYNQNRHVIYANPISKNIIPIHKKIKELLGKKGIDTNNSNFDYKPHITIKYSKNEIPNLKDFKTDLSFEVNHLVLTDKGQKYTVRFD